MRIASVKSLLVGTPPPHKGGVNWIFVKLTTDEGLVGYGQPNFVGSRERSTISLIEELAERWVVGADPFDIEKLWRLMYCRVHDLQHPDVTRMAAISAIEMACWDIIGKALNQPVYNLLGGKYNEKLRAYSYMYKWRHGDSPEQAAESAAYYTDLGFTAIGFDPVGSSFPNPRELSLETLRYAERVVGAVRRQVGDKCDILIKTHGQMTTHAAIRLARRLEQFDPQWFEEPVPPENADEMAVVARATSIPIAAGERLTTKYDFVRILEKHAAQILQVSLGCVGGILEAKKIAGMAEAHYAQIAPWMYTGPIAGSASIQLATCSPNLLMQEGIETWDGFHAEILKEPVRWEKGYIIPSTRPGLGVELDEEVAAKHPYNPPAG